jgi:hypothetical protein
MLSSTYYMLSRLKRLLRRSSALEEMVLEDTQPRPMDERRREALSYLVIDYRKSKERMEELQRRIESMNPIIRLFYKGYLSIRSFAFVFAELVAKPLGLALLTFSGSISVLIANYVMYDAARFIDRVVPFPLNYPTTFLLATCIVFSPFIVSFEVYSRRERDRERKMLKEEYGIEV